MCRKTGSSEVLASIVSSIITVVKFYGFLEVKKRVRVQLYVYSNVCTVKKSSSHWSDTKYCMLRGKSILFSFYLAENKKFSHS